MLSSDLHRQLSSEDKKAWRQLSDDGKAMFIKHLPTSAECSHVTSKSDKFDWTERFVLLSKATINLRHDRLRKLVILGNAVKQDSDCANPQG